MRPGERAGQRWTAARRRGPDRHTQVASSKARCRPEALPEVPLSPRPTRAALRDGPWAALPRGAGGEASVRAGEGEGGVRSPKYTSLLHLGHLGMVAPDRGRWPGGSRPERWTGWVAPGPRLSRTPGSAPLGHAPSAPPPEFWTWTRRPRIPANMPRKVIWSTLALGQDPGLADGRARSEGCRRSAGTLADWTGLQPRRSPALAPDSGRGLLRAEGSTPPPAPECWSPEGNRYNADRCKRACCTFPGLSLDTGQRAPTRAFSAW